MAHLNTYLWGVLLLILFSCQDKKQPGFDELNASPEWKLQLSDPCTTDWQTHWFLDGQLATLENRETGMNFQAGPLNRNDAHHAVLWTKASFQGDLKLEYTYTRTDSQIINVNILYLQAQGIGEGPYAADISQWSELRTVPSMRIYFTYMNALHISYAAFGTKNEDPAADYVRARKYPASEETPFRETEIPPSFDRTGLFLPHVPYHITVIKADSMLYFQVKGKQKEQLFSWHVPNSNPLQAGRIGLRHMYTRSAEYRDFRVFTK
jgi:hypothetical protein